MSRNIFGDKKFLDNLLHIAVPIAVQTFITSSLNLLDVLMIGQLGDVSIAALGLANQIFFLLQLFLFGVTSGTAIFTAQFWGQRDIPNIRKLLGICLTTAIAASLIFTIGAILSPQTLLGFYTKDPDVIAKGSEYLRIVGLSYTLTAISFSYTAVLRSTQHVKLPMIVSTISLGINSLLNYALILGNFGLPALGVRGAAIGTTIARSMEFAALISLTYFLKTPAAARLRELLAFDFKFFKHTLQTTLPVVITEVLWSLGMTTYNAIYARIGTESIAAYNITSTIQSMAFVIFAGLAHGGAIIIGNEIGANKRNTAIQYSKQFLRIGILCTALTELAIFLIRDPVLSLYKISPSSYIFARNILTIFSFVMWIKACNFILFIAILRSGGDTRFAMILQSITLWLIGVPISLLGAFVLRLPIHWVYLMAYIEEIIKLFIAYQRYRTGKWIHNLARAV